MVVVPATRDRAAANIPAADLEEIRAQRSGSLAGASCPNSDDLRGRHFNSLKNQFREGARYASEAALLRSAGS